MTRTITLTLLLTLGSTPLASAAEPAVTVVLRSGELLSGELLAADAQSFRLQVGDTPRELDRPGVARLVFAPPPAQRAQAAAARLTTVRGDWTLRGPLALVVRDLALHADRAIELDARLDGRVDLELRDRTWREALSVAAGTCGGGLEPLAGEALRVAPDAVDAPFLLVPRRPLPEVEPMHNAALTWLRRHQHPDGSWGGAADEPSVGATALALLAFLGDGHTHRFRDAKETVSRALRWLLEHTPSADAPAPGLEDALRACALAEIYAVSRDFTLKRPAVEAAQRLLAAQRPDGGWGFAPHQAGNTLATAQAVVALRSAEVAQCDPTEAYGQAARFLARATGADGVAGYRHPGGGLSLTLAGADAGPAVPLFTAAVAAARIVCGAPVDDAELRAATAVLAGAPPRPAHPASAYLYFATRSLFGLRDQEQTAWRGWTRDLLLTLAAQQVKSGDDAGSWAPAGLYGQLFGRAGATATALHALQLKLRADRARPASEEPAAREGGAGD